MIEVEWGIQHPDGTVTLWLMESAARRRVKAGDRLVRRIMIYSEWELA